MLICQNCNREVPAAARFCDRCGSALFANTPTPQPLTMTPIYDAGSNQFRNPEGIEGWLVVVAFGLAVAPVIIARTILRTDFPLLFGRGTLAASFVGAVFSLKNLISFGALVLLNCLFYLRKRSFPIAMMAYYGWAILTRFAEHIVYAAASPGREIHFIGYTVFAPLISAAVWVPYLLISKRVKMTFVR
jgi:hypothetical protein